MFLGSNERILSKVLIMTALISLMGRVLSFITRIVVKGFSLEPDMMNSHSWTVSRTVSFIQIILTVVVFSVCWQRLNRIINTVPEEDRKQMGLLQEEFLGSSLPSLTAEDERKLLEIWGVVLIGSQCFYQMSSFMYRKFIEELAGAMAGNVEGFYSIYNNSHGFKYLGMLVAVLLGVIITGIFLGDRSLKICGFITAVIFMIVFALARMQTVSFNGHYVGIVWSSFLFHLIDVGGLIALGVYLRKRYRGV